MGTVLTYTYHSETVPKPFSKLFYLQNRTLYGSVWFCKLFTNRSFTPTRFSKRRSSLTVLQNQDRAQNRRNPHPLRLPSWASPYPELLRQPPSMTRLSTRHNSLFPQILYGGAPINEVLEYQALSCICGSSNIAVGDWLSNNEEHDPNCLNENFGDHSMASDCRNNRNICSLDLRARMVRAFDIVSSQLLSRGRYEDACRFIRET